MVDISFVTSCYNSEQYLDGLIENLLQQSHTDFELIIVDSASTDNSVAIIQRWMEQDPRIQLIEQNERTPYGMSWLIGWQQAQGKVVTNSNTDDRSYPWRGSQVMQAQEGARFKSDSPLSFYYGGYETRVDGTAIAKGTPPPYSSADFQRFFRCGIHIHWDNNIRERVDWEMMFKAGHEYKSAFDYWLVLYFISLGVVGRTIPSCFSIYNQRSDSLEQSNKELSSFEAMRAIGTFFPAGLAMHDLETKTKFESPEYYARYKEFLREFA